MKNPFTALFLARDKPQDSVSAAPTFYFGTSGSGKAVNANTAIFRYTIEIAESIRYNVLCLDEKNRKVQRIVRNRTGGNNL